MHANVEEYEEHFESGGCGGMPRDADPLDGIYRGGILVGRLRIERFWVRSVVECNGGGRLGIDEEVVGCPRRYSEREDTLGHATSSSVQQSTPSVTVSWGIGEAPYTFKFVDGHTAPAPGPVAVI
jgi:hypothetical protein